MRTFVELLLTLIALHLPTSLFGCGEMPSSSKNASIEATPTPTSTNTKYQITVDVIPFSGIDTGGLIVDEYNLTQPYHSAQYEDGIRCGTFSGVLNDEGNVASGVSEHCNYPYEVGSTITLYAIPNQLPPVFYYEFDHFEGCDTESTDSYTCTVTVNSDRKILAYFKEAEEIEEINLTIDMNMMGALDNSHTGILSLVSSDGKIDCQNEIETNTLSGKCSAIFDRYDTIEFTFIPQNPENVNYYVDDWIIDTQYSSDKYICTDDGTSKSELICSFTLQDVLSFKLENEAKLIVSYAYK